LIYIVRVAHTIQFDTFVVVVVVVKNSLESGVEAVANGNLAPGTMSSAESDKYIQNQRKLKFVGVDVPVTSTHDDDLVTIGGIPVTPGPRIILCPAFTISQQEMMTKLKGGRITITQRSSLVLEGHLLFVKNLSLDGALVIRTGPESEVTVDGLTVKNKGWGLEEIPKDGAHNVPETVRIRGYTMAKHETMEIIIREAGKFLIGPDGAVQKLE
jgi:UDP-sugar pyrophosphorylase